MALSVPIVVPSDNLVDPTVNDDENDGFLVGAVWVNTVTGATFVLRDASVGAAVWVPIAGTGTWRKDEFVPTNGQVTFILSLAPTDADSLFFDVNGVIYDDASDFTISGVTVTWLNTFVMATDDKVIIRYR